MPKKKLTNKQMAVISGIISGVIILGAAGSCLGNMGEPTPTDHPTITISPTQRPTATNPPRPTTTPRPKPTTPPTQEPALTPAQENAISKATEYLDFGAFSEKSLIDQLEYEGFKTADAKFAIKHIDVNWNEQAELKAREYLATGSFSRKSLTDQLVFEGFTSAQAKHGVDVTGL